MYEPEKWQTGDMEAFEALFRQHKELVLKTAMLITNNAEEAEDVLQEVFMNIWRKRHTFDNTKGKFTTWLYRITINQSINRYRRKKPVIVSIDETSCDPSSRFTQDLPEEALEINWEYKRLLEAIDLLDNNHRLVLILRYINDLSIKEIAEVLDIPVGTVKSRTHNALKALHRQMEEVKNINVLNEERQ
jgi:RNA polymerase sigma-70 factor (ECF subfamily)